MLHTMYAMTQELADITERIRPILQNSAVQRAAIFGSYARGEQTPESDVDILVEHADSATLFDVANLQEQLERALGKRVDLVGYRTIKPRLRSSILSATQPII